MPKDIDLPDGSVAVFPDDMPDSEIQAVLRKQFPPEQPGAAARFGTGLYSTTVAPVVAMATPPDLSSGRGLVEAALGPGARLVMSMFESARQKAGAAVQAAKEGDYAEAAKSGLGALYGTGPVGDTLSTVGVPLAQGDVAGAAGAATGLGLTAMAPAIGRGTAAMGRAVVSPKGTAVLKGAGKVAGGAAVVGAGQVVGHPFLGYMLGADIARRGFKDIKRALKRKAATSGAENSTTKPPATAAVPGVEAAEASLLEDLAQSQAGKKFSSLDPAQQATVRDIAKRIQAQSEPPPKPPTTATEAVPPPLSKPTTAAAREATPPPPPFSGNTADPTPVVPRGTSKAAEPATTTTPATTKVVEAAPQVAVPTPPETSPTPSGRPKAASPESPPSKAQVVDNPDLVPLLRESLRRITQEPYQAAMKQEMAAKAVKARAIGETMEGGARTLKAESYANLLKGRGITGIDVAQLPMDSPFWATAAEELRNTMINSGELTWEQAQRMKFKPPSARTVAQIVKMLDEEPAGPVAVPAVAATPPAVAPPKPQAVPPEATAAPIKAPQASTNWLEGLSPEKRESAFAKMRAIDAEGEAARTKSRSLSPSGGAIPVGGGHMDPIFRAEAVDGFLGALRRGATPKQAVEAGNLRANQAIQKWNASRKDYQVQRALDMEQSHLWDLARRFLQE